MWLRCLWGHCVFFFFSSRRRHTRSLRDWSSDVCSSDLDGLEVLQNMRTDPELRTTPVVMLTSSREEQDIVRSYGLGVNAYVVKPVDFQNFVSAIAELGLFWAVLNQPPLPADRNSRP